jgi:thiol-disulfide isomerase/thioredoxin
MKKAYTALFLILLLQLPSAAADALLPVGSEARKFLLLDTDGQRLGLKDWIGDKAPRKKSLVIINFWSLSCVPCREEMPKLQEFSNKNAGQVTVIFINLDSKDQAAIVKERIQQMGISTALLDPYQVTGKNYNVCSAQGSCNVPALYGIAQNGNIVLAHSGYEGPAALESQLATALAQASASAPSPANIVKDKNALLLEVHQSAPLDAIAKRNGISKQELVQLLKEAETSARNTWK